MVLTAATVAAAYVNLGALNIVVALAIATVKATLVVLYFMHARYSPKRTQLGDHLGGFLAGHYAGPDPQRLQHPPARRCGERHRHAKLLQLAAFTLVMKLGFSTRKEK